MYHSWAAHVFAFVLHLFFCTQHTHTHTHKRPHNPTHYKRRDNKEGKQRKQIRPKALSLVFPTSQCEGILIQELRLTLSVCVCLCAIFACLSMCVCVGTRVWELIWGAILRPEKVFPELNKDLKDGGDSGELCVNCLFFFFPCFHVLRCSCSQEKQHFSPLFCWFEPCVLTWNVISCFWGICRLI